MSIVLTLFSLHISLCYSPVLKKWFEEVYNLNHIFYSELKKKKQRQIPNIILHSYVYTSVQDVLST